jgi:hypothetical protein
MVLETTTSNDQIYIFDKKLINDGFEVIKPQLLKHTYGR